MKRSIILILLLVAGVTVLAIGMLAGFAGPVAAEVSTSVDATVDQLTIPQYAEQTNVQAAVVESAATQDISVDEV